jgi:hypothetical protein
MKSKICIGLLLLSQTGFAQKFESYLSDYLGKNGQGYLQPLADLTISGLNTGLPSSIKIEDRFYVRLNLNALQIMPHASQRTFMGESEGTNPVTHEAPTIIGDNHNVKVNNPDGTRYVFSGGYNIGSLRWGVPQISFGGIKGSEISARFMTFGTKNDFGKFQQIGVGVRHSLGQYFIKKTSPFAVNLGYQFNQSDIGNYMKMQSHYAYLQAGVTTKNIGFFAYGGYQTGKFDIFYTYTESQKSEKVEVNLKNQYPILAGIGTHIQLGFFSLTLGAAGPKPLVLFGNLGFRFMSKSKQTKP